MKKTEKKKQGLQFKISGGDPTKIEIVGKGSSDGNQLYDAVNVKYTDTLSRPEMLNSVMVSPSVYDTYRGAVVSLISLQNHRSIDVKLISGKSLQGGEIKPSSFVKDYLTADKDSELYLCKHQTVKITEVNIQRIDDIKEDTVTVSAEVYDETIKDSKYSLYQFIEMNSGRSFILKTSHIKRAPKKEPTENGEANKKKAEKRTIKMNRKQRQFLGLIVPPFLNERQWQILTDSTRLSADEIKTVEKAYSRKEENETRKPVKEHLLNDAELTYEERKTIENLIKKYLTDVRIIPVIESFCHKNKRRPLRALADFYVGKSTLSLACRRPYENDENSDIVRISRSNMRLLGIDEMDKVVLKYKNKEVICRALEIDNANHFFRNNKPLNVDLSVGVPAHIRKKLGVPDVLSCVKIDRYTPFIFQRSINEQILPVILTLFSSEVLAWQNIALSICLPLLAIPIVVYINLSSKRNMHA